MNEINIYWMHTSTGKCVFAATDAGVEEVKKQYITGEVVKYGPVEAAGPLVQQTVARMMPDILKHGFAFVGAT